MGITSTGTKVEDITYSSNREILYVGGSGSGNYSSIQEAIDNSSNGDLVFVYDDLSPYCEHLTIKQSITLIGEKKDTTKINGIGKDKNIILIKSFNVGINGFTIQYATDRYSGISITNSFQVTIEDCKFSNIPSMDAITVSNSENITMNNCIMSDTLENNIIKCSQDNRYISGITLEGGCSNTTISGNTISNASYAGIIVLEGCNNTKIIENYIHSNDKYGIRTQYCNYTYIEENIISKNHLQGIAVYACSYAFIYRNSCENNGKSGIGIGDSIATIIEDNNFISNGVIGYFSYNFGEDYLNILPDIMWSGNYWNRARIFPKLIWGSVVFQSNHQSPIIIIPWINIDWNPAKEPFDIGV
jgi:parallel beta-helix repeat protein